MTVTGDRYGRVAAIADFTVYDRLSATVSSISKISVLEGGISPYCFLQKV